MLPRPNKGLKNEIKTTIATIFLLLTLLQHVHAIDEGTASSWYFDLVPFDLTYQLLATNTTGNFFLGYANPSMPLSLAMSNNLYLGGHWAIKYFFNPEKDLSNFIVHYAVTIGFDFLANYLPFGLTWLHEEYHRNVLTRYEVSSINQANFFPFGKDAVYVFGIQDSGLAKINDNHNADFRRLMTAGDEAQYHQIQRLQMYNFFYKEKLTHHILYILSTSNSIAYVFSSASGDLDEFVNKTNQKESTQHERDFTGPDFTAWVKALFDPNEPYSARGPHPLGNGINRYIKASQLSKHAKYYLANVSLLHIINLVSPMMLGFTEIPIGTNSNGPMSFNFAFRNILTSFGTDTNLDLFFKDPTLNLLFTFHVYRNYTSTFLGLEGTLWDYVLFKTPARLTLRGMVWQQPKDQSFTTTEGAFGGLLTLRFNYRIGLFSPYLELEAKTPGWVMGNVFLNENLSGRIGTHIYLPSK
jgi:hypothetical protein